jgi:glutamate-1-semialdehyde 2,1-aminomutase
VAAGIGDAVVARHGTLLAVLFGADAPPTHYDEVAACDHERYGRFFHAMLDEGVYLAPSGYEVVFPSVALTGDVVDRVRDAATAAAREVA